MPLHLTPLEYLLARLNLLPVPLFDTPLAPGIAKMLVTACELGLFDTLGKQGASLERLAEQLKCHPQSLQFLLHILMSSGYLRYHHGKYFNTPITQRWLMSESPKNIAPYIVHSPDIIALWDHITDVLRTNQPARHLPYTADATSQETQQFLARHYAGLASLATALGGEILQRVRLPNGAKHLLDVGGSHAGYSALFCRKYPHLHATILDVQSGIVVGEQTARQMSLTERMSFVCSDIVQDDFPLLFPHPFDVALFFHIAHLFPPELNILLLEKVAKTLRPGGLLIIVDQITDQTSRSRLASLIVQLMALTTTTVGGTCYPFGTLKRWLELVGLEAVRCHRLLSPGVNLITAYKKLHPRQ
jgi:SAM-dependent methyltransferase